MLDLDLPLFYRKFIPKLTLDEKEFVLNFIDQYKHEEKDVVNVAIQMLITTEEFRDDHNHMLELLSVWNLSRSNIYSRYNTNFN